MSTPQRYEDIEILFADPAKAFPEDFNPDYPFRVEHIKRVSYKGFVATMDREHVAALVALEDFDPQAFHIEEMSPVDVELHDGATFIAILNVYPTSLERRIESIREYQRCQDEVAKRGLIPYSVNLLKGMGYSDAKPVCVKEFFDDAGRKKGIHAAAISEHYAVVAEYQQGMDVDGALSLLKKMDFIDANKNGNGNVNIFAGRQLIGVLGGTVEVAHEKRKEKMDKLLKSRGCRKVFTTQEFCRADGSPIIPKGPMPGEGTSGSPGRGGTTAAALAPMRMNPAFHCRHAKPFGRLMMLGLPRLATALRCRLAL